MKRIVLFVITNIAVLLVLSMVFKLLGVDKLLFQQGVRINFTAVLIFAAIFGMGGALISLLLSKTMAKRGMGVRIIEPESTDSEDQWLLQTVRLQAERSGIGMPEVGIFDSDEPNAFATGANRNNSLVAVSTGLLEHMSRPEVEAVLGHEVSHVANGDMVTLTLLQGILNTFVLALSRVIGFVVDKVLLKNERGMGIGYYVTVIITEIILAFLATIIVMWFSRKREYAADRGGADLAGRQNMIAALQALQRAHEPHDLPGQFSAFGIAGGLGSGLRRLFMSHPPLEERIAALQQGR